MRKLLTIPDIGIVSEEIDFIAEDNGSYRIDFSKRTSELENTIFSKFPTDQLLAMDVTPDRISIRAALPDGYRLTIQ